MAIVEELGGNVKNWTDISKKMVPFTRTPKQCRERYHQNLKPNLNKDPITEEEGEKINYMVIKHGKKWAFIARSLNNGRSDNTVKNWWNLKEGKKKRLKAKLEKKKLSEFKNIEDTEKNPVMVEEPSPARNIQPVEKPMNIDNRASQPAFHINGLNMNPNYEWMSNELAKGNLIGMPVNIYAQQNMRPYDNNLTAKNSIFNQNIFSNNQNDLPQVDGMMGFMKNGSMASNSFGDLAKYYNIQPMPQLMNGRMQSIDSFMINNINYSPASNNSNNEQHRVSITHSALSASNNLPGTKEDDKGIRTRESSILALNQQPMQNNILPISRRASQFFLQQQQNTDLMNDKMRQSNITFRQPFIQTPSPQNMKKLPQGVKNNFSSPLGIQNKGQESNVFKSNYSINQAASNNDGRRRSTLANILNNDPE